MKKLQVKNKSLQRGLDKINGPYEVVTILLLIATVVALIYLWRSL